jgi:5-methylcytosine-specific restriction endonuclease McrA
MAKRCCPLGHIAQYEEPCPVCGSSSHKERPAQLGEGAARAPLPPIRLCHCGRPLPCAEHTRVRRSGSSRPSLDTAAWRKTRAWVRQRDGNRCTECGETTGLVVHHLVRPQDGGTDETSNLTTLCRICHGNAHLARREA